MPPSRPRPEDALRAAGLNLSLTSSEASKDGPRETRWRSPHAGPQDALRPKSSSVYPTGSFLLIVPSTSNALQPSAPIIVGRRDGGELDRDHVACRDQRIRIVGVAKPAALQRLHIFLHGVNGVASERNRQRSSLFRRFCDQGVVGDQRLRRRLSPSGDLLIGRPASDAAEAGRNLFVSRLNAAGVGWDDRQRPMVSWQDSTDLEAARQDPSSPNQRPIHGEAAGRAGEPARPAVSLPTPPCVPIRLSQRTRILRFDRSACPHDPIAHRPVRGSPFHRRSCSVSS